jgi:hypothetical protein
MQQTKILYFLCNWHFGLELISFFPYMESNFIEMSLLIFFLFWIELKMNCL